MVSEDIDLLVAQIGKLQDELVQLQLRVRNREQEEAEAARVAADA